MSGDGSRCEQGRVSTPFLVGVSAITALGLVVRLHRLDGQVLLDDELHALLYVLNRPWSSAWSAHSMGANSIPVNIITWLLLHYGHWSEITLRFPSVLHGSGAIALTAMLGRRLLTSRSALLGGLLLALSPLAIFYSRTARPFASVLFWGALALFSLMLRLQQGDRRWSLAWAGTAFLAVYHHLWSLPAVLGPALALLVLACAPGRSALRWFPDASIPPARELALALSLLAALLLAFVVPAAISNPWWLDHLEKDRVSPASWWGLLQLWTGSENRVLIALFASGAAVGAWQWGRLAPGPAFLLLMASLGQATAFLVSTQDDIHAPIQIARYSICLLPFAYLLFAQGVGVVTDVVSPQWRARTFFAASAIWLLAVSLMGPALRSGTSPRNFTNHSAYQYDYAPAPRGSVRERVFMPGLGLTPDSVPVVYRELAGRADIPGVLVYPMLCGDHFNPIYAWQEILEKEVHVGYRADIRFPPLPHGDAWIYANMPLDYIFGRVPPTHVERIRFQSMVPVHDAQSLMKTHPGWAFVIHEKNPLREFWGAIFPGEVEDYGPAVDLARRLQNQGVLSVLADRDSTIVFLVPPARD